MLAAALVLLLAQAQDPASRAYEAVRQREWEAAGALFREAVAAEPEKAALRKDFAYACLKAGEVEAARDQFAEAMRLDPADEQAALEFAFLANETGRKAEARRVFDRLRRGGNGLAEQAFQNIDGALTEAIARWKDVVARAPDNHSAHRELARLLEERGETEAAAEHCLAAWRLRPAGRELLTDLGRLWLASGRGEQATAALIAASRGAAAHAADTAREMLPRRYPYVSEFRAGLALDPGNVELRRELAYLLLAMGRENDAEQEFRAALKAAPDDRLSLAQLGFLLLARGERQAGVELLERVLASADDELSARVRATLKYPPKLGQRPAVPPAGAKELGQRSYEAGMLSDALKQFTTAYENDPLDFAVMLRLGWTLNMLKNDGRAAGWFRLAAKSPEPAIAAEAAKAYRNLKAGADKVKTTVWVFPFWSTRWHDAISYAQAKTEFTVRRLPLRPYLSVRFSGNTRELPGEAGPQYLSETAFIVGAGVRSRPWRGVTLWAEAGEALSYRNRPGRMKPDYRGGAAWAGSAGMPIGGEASGWFTDLSADAVFLSRFDNDLIAYVQTKAGYTLPPAGPFRSQLYANLNFSADAKREYWANTVETGPGARFRWDPLPVTFSVNLLRGAYSRNSGNPRGPNFYDLRAGFWYAFTR